MNLTCATKEERPLRKSATMLDNMTVDTLTKRIDHALEEVVISMDRILVMMHERQKLIEKDAEEKIKGM